MRTPQRRIDPGVIRRLLKQPHRYQFFQAVRLLEQLFARRGSTSSEHALATRVSFRNTLSLSFPPSELQGIEAESLTPDMLETDEAFIAALEEGALATEGDVICLASELVAEVTAATGIIGTETLATLKGTDIEGTVSRHPMHDQGYDHDVPMLLADYVTTEQGTGFVHIAPGHGVEDYELAHLEHGIPLPDTVAEDGRLMDHLPLFAGLHVLRDNARIAEIMAGHGGLIGIGKLVHSYPHSWRSKAPLVYRNTSQWFVSMESHGLRDTAVALGLAAVLGIVRGHDGALAVNSTPGEGTAFKLLLPVRQADGLEPKDRSESGLILVVDDEEFVRTSLRQMLERVGYGVVDAEDAEAGLLMFRERQDELRAVLLDLAMPRMDGVEAFRRMQRIDKDVPVILMSGYDEWGAPQRFGKEPLAGFLSKPILTDILLAKIREVSTPLGGR